MRFSRFGEEGSVFPEYAFDPMVITADRVAPTMSFDPLDIIGLSPDAKARQAASAAFDAAVKYRKYLVWAGVAVGAYVIWAKLLKSKKAAPALAGYRRRRRNRR